MRRILLLGLATVALVAAACGSDAGQPRGDAGSAGRPGAGSGTGSGSGDVVTLPRPDVFADIATVELLAPGRSNAGAAPIFEWKPVSGADAYRLSVLAPDGPTWAWTGEATSIRYGGVEEGVPGPALMAGSWWSVAALGADDAVIAMSELRAVSPGADLGPAPEWTSVRPATGQPSPSADPGAGSMGEQICDLLVPDEITGLIKGAWGAGSGETYPTGKTGRCEWTSVNGTLFTISVLGADSYDPEGWNADGDVPDLGSKAYYAKSFWDYRIGFVSADYSVTLVIDYLKVDQPGFADLARLVESRLP